MVKGEDKPKPTEKDYRKAVELYNKLMDITRDIFPSSKKMHDDPVYRDRVLDALAEYITKERADAARQTRADIKDNLKKWLKS